MSIPDDATAVAPIFEQMKDYHKTRETHSVEFRKKALESLLAGYDKLRPEFDEALNKDLGINPFMANFLAHAVTTAEIKDVLEQVD